MKHKVVIHPDYGCYYLSDKAVHWLSEHGSEKTKRFIKEHPDDKVRTTSGYLGDFLERHNPDLIAVVEAIGKEASHFDDELAVVEIESNKYYIEEYDGRETIITPEDCDWVVID